MPNEVHGNTAVATTKSASSKGPIADWKQYWDSRMKSFNVPGSQQLPNTWVPKGSAAEKWTDAAINRNKGNPDYWIGYYKNPKDGTVLAENDDGQVAIFSAQGRLIAKGTDGNAGGKITGFTAQY